MKKTTLFIFLLIASVAQSQVNLGKLKDKVKDKTSDVSKPAIPSANNMEKGNAAFDAKNYEEAKSFYQKAYNASSSDYNKSQIKGQINDCDVWIKYCSETKEKIESLNSQKQFGDLVEFYDDQSKDYEKRCICDDNMKTLVENARKGAVVQKEEKEKQANADATAKKDAEEASMYKCSDLKPDAAITDPIHLKNKQKILFSKTQILDANTNESIFTNSFDITDDIYSRIFLENSVDFEHYNIGDCFNVGYIVRWTFNDGSTILPEWIGLNKDKVSDGTSKTAWTHRISPNVNDMYKYIDAKNKYGEKIKDVSFDVRTIKDYVDVVKNLPAGKHKIKLEIVYDIPEDATKPNSSAEFHKKLTTKFGPEKILASGEYTLNVTEESKRSLYKKVCKLYVNEVEDYNRSTFSVVSNASSLIKADKGIDWNKYTLLKIVGEKDWSYEKNYFGVILSRSVSAKAYVLNKEDGFVYLSQLGFYQENTSSGGSTYGSIKTTVEPLNIEYTRGYDAFCKECIGK